MEWRGDRLKAVRTELNWSQSKLARKVGAHVTSISDWERNANQPSARHLATICDLTGKPASYFFGAEERVNEDPASGLLSALKRYVDSRVAPA